MPTSCPGPLSVAADRRRLALRPLAFALLLLTLGPLCAVRADTPAPGGQALFAAALDRFVARLDKATSADCTRSFGRYLPVVARQVDLDRLFCTAYEDLDDLLNQAVASGMDALSLFTLPLLQQRGRPALLLDAEILARLDRRFDLHGLFIVRPTDLADDRPAPMRFLLAGHGKLIIGYARNATVRHPDYAFATGRYDYKELFVMDVREDADRNPGLFDIKGLGHPDDDPRWMKGPLNADIRSFRLTAAAGGAPRVLIHYDLFGVHSKIIACIPIERRPPAAQGAN